MFFKKWQQFFSQPTSEMLMEKHLQLAKDSRIEWLESVYQYPQIGQKKLNLNQVGVVDYQEHPLLFQTLLFSSIDCLIKKYQTSMLKTLSSLHSDMNQEQKSLEWLKTSLYVYKNAIQECARDQSLIFQFQLFFGKHPQKNSDLFKLRSFNIDLEILFMTDGRLKVTVYDDPTCLFDQELSPKLNSEFILVRPQIYDEIIQLLEQVSLTVKQIN